MNLSTLKKSEVDLRVAQELKNNKDFIYRTNQEIQNLKGLVNDLNEQHQKLIAKFDSETKSVVIDFENHSDENKQLTHKLELRISEFENSFNKVLSGITSKIDHVCRSYSSNDQVDRKFNQIADGLECFEESFSKLCGDLAACVMTLQGNIKEESNLIRKELAPKPQDHLATKAEIDDRLNVFKVDFDGLVREIALLKKAVSYDDKKFENIYTLIERLKTGKT